MVAELSSPQHETDDGQSSTGRHGVYVYNLGTAYTSGISKSPWNSGRNWDCHRTMYSMDVRLHKWLLRPDMRASSPESAAAYFIPFYQSCLRHACAKPSKLHCMWNETNQFENPSVGDGRVKALKQVMELYPWFNRSKGRDHFITLTHDLASIERIGSSFIDPLVIPDQKSQLRRIVTSSDRHRGFLRGRDYSIPPRLFAWQGVVRVNRTNRRLAADRSPDIYFRGAFDNSYSSPIRAEVWRHWGCTHEHNDSCTRQSGGQVYVMNRHAPQPNDVPYLTRLQRSRFCLHMPGHQYWSPRLFEAIVEGCIPVAIVSNASADPLEGYAFPFLEELPVGRRQPPVLTYGMADIPRLPQLLFSLPNATLSRMMRVMDAYSGMIYPEQKVLARISTWMRRTGRWATLEYQTCIQTPVFKSFYSCPHCI